MPWIFFFDGLGKRAQYSNFSFPIRQSEIWVTKPLLYKVSAQRTPQANAFLCVVCNPQVTFHTRWRWFASLTFAIAQVHTEVV